ncbi:ABC transporter ATP-binding protein [Vagococcus salmoninarum]|uniref:ABC transporter ATP-binding protein n=1 Tax=Vagococcus salmoninarum TaxID=2739 RepID=UPI003F99EEC8
MNEIELKNVSKNYGETAVITNLNLKIKEGERLVLLGPSGCGKSTTLRMIAGLEGISQGDLYLNGQKATNLPSGEREMAMVFQNYALYPNMTVTENIVFGLKANKVEKTEIERRLEKVLIMLRLEKYRDRLPKDLSGGQRQRVALARAVVKRSKYFLLDEPLSNLDVTLRHSARKQLVEIHETYHQTFVYVTHDQVEAMTIGQRIVLLNEGEIQMIDTPERVYHFPSNLFTASFIGSPKMNLLPATYQKGLVGLSEQVIELSQGWQDYLVEQEQAKLVLGIRPEHLKLSKTPKENSLKGQVKYIENLGATFAITVLVGESEWLVLDDYKKWQVTDEVYLRFNFYKLHFFDPVTTNTLGYPKEIIDHDNFCE